MYAYIIRRLWQMVPTLAGVVLLVFILFHYFGYEVGGNLVVSDLNPLWSQFPDNLARNVIDELACEQHPLSLSLSA